MDFDCRQQPFDVLGWVRQVMGMHLDGGFVGFGRCGRCGRGGGRFCLQLVKPFENHCVNGGALAFGGFGNKFPGDGVFLEGGWLLLVGHWTRLDAMDNQSKKPYKCQDVKQTQSSR